MIFFPCGGRIVDESNLLDHAANQGALRSRAVSKLAGVSLRQLWYWHSTGLIEANTDPGARGYPRLYSWIDYMKLRAARKLIREGEPTRRVRAAIAFLDREIPDWYRWPLFRYEGRILIERHNTLFVAAVGQQRALPVLSHVLNELVVEGPLGELRSYADVVDMDPDVVAGNPVMRGTRLEAALLLGLSERGVGVPAICEAYNLESGQVMRILEFAQAIS